MCRLVSEQFEVGIEAPAAARRFARHTLGAWGLSELIPDVSLLVSELVTNAVKHARTRCTLALCVAEGHLEVSVGDKAGHLPVPGAPGETATVREGGRGLQLVDIVAREWGVVHQGGRKEVWFRLPVPSRWPWRAHCPCEGDEGAPRTGSGRSVRAVSGPWDRLGTVTPLR